MSGVATNAYALHGIDPGPGLSRWGLSALAIVLIHVALIAAGMAWYAQPMPPGVTSQVITLDLAPATTSPMPVAQDVAPGPEMQQAEEAAAPPPEPPPPAVQEQIPPAPPQQNPVVAAPLEAKPVPTPPKPEPVRTEAKPEPKPKPVKPRPRPKPAKRSTDHPSAPRTSAAPKADQRAERIAAAQAGAAAAAALPSYRQMLAAHLQRFKQYPAAAKAAGEQGVALLSFTVSRSGRVLSSRLARSSGHAALDAETLAMIRRAEPLPAFPPEIKQGSMAFVVPISFAVR